MSKSSALRSFNCPNCHAPLDVDTTQPLIKCEYCGTMVEVPTTLRDTPKPKPQPQPKPKPAPSPPTARPYTPKPKSHGSSGASGCGVVFFFILFIGGIIAGALYLEARSGVANPLSDLLPSLISIGTQGHLLPPESGRDTNLADALVVTHKTEGYALAYLDNTTHTVRWETDKSEEYPSLLDVTGNDQFVFVADEDHLIAYNRADGSIGWQTTLSDVIFSACDCWQIFADTLVILTDDGVIQAYEISTGTSTWNLRLDATPRGLYRAGEQVAVLDEVEGNVVLRLFDSVTGQLTRDLQPRGRNEPFGEDSPQLPGIYDPVYQDPTGQYLYFFMGFFEPGTVQKWDGTTGELVWEVTGPVDEIKPDYDEHPLFVDGRIYIGNGHDLGMIDEATQTYQLLTNSADYELRPLTVQNNVLLVLAQRTRGTARQELWGLDATNGALRWQYVPTAKTFLEPAEYSSVSSNDGSWMAFWPHQTAQSDTIILFQIFPEPDEVVIERLNVTDGTTSPIGTTDLGEISGSTFFTDLGEYRGIQWLLIERKMYALPLDTGVLDRRWP